METLVLMGGFVYIGVLGFWVMGKIDRFISEGGFSPDWDEEEERKAAFKLFIASETPTAASPPLSFGLDCDILFRVWQWRHTMTDYFHLNMDQDHLLALSSLGLAHLGDAVFEVMVRSWLCLHGKATARNLHRATVRYVAATAQARRAERILPLLSEEESDVFRRGRNTAPHSVPKGASRGEYQSATALEALFGWLYLQGRTERLNHLFALMMEEE